MKQPVYNRHKSPIGAHEEVTVHSVGNLVSLLGATGPVEIAMGDGPFIPLDVGQTVSFQDEQFSSVRIRDVSGLNNDFDLYVGRGEFFDLRFSAQGDIQIRPVLTDRMVTGPAVTALDAQATLVAPANAKRREVILVLNGTAPNSVVVSGDPAAQPWEGLPLQPGQSMTLATAADIYVRNDSGGNALVYVAELEYVA